MLQQKEISGYLNLAQRAGKIIFGSNLVLGSRPEKLLLVLAAADLGKSTREKLTRHCKMGQLILTDINPGLLLKREQVKVLAITDAGLAQKIAELCV